MSVPSADYVRNMHLSVVAWIRAGLVGYPQLSDTLQFPGTKDPAEGAEEWLAFYPLGVYPRRKPDGMWFATVLFQISCAALFSEHRADKDAMRPFTIAGLLRTILDSKDIPLYLYGLDGTKGARTGILSVHEGTERYVNQRAGAASGLPSSLGVGVPLNSHIVALSYRAVTDIHI